MNNRHIHHNVHIPVMGTGFTIDSPIKIAKYGLSSVISIGDDELCENMREYYTKEYGKTFHPITKKEEDYRAKRITAYLDLVHNIVNKQIETLKVLPFEPNSDISKYFEMLPTRSPLRKTYLKMLKETSAEKQKELQNKLRKEIKAGSIDVNIMTKLDRTNTDKEGNPLPDRFSDALSALRGYANSKLESSIVFSAGFNRRLYSYIEKFKDFFPDNTGNIKKKIILKVSDFRSSLTQGKFLAKKGIWVSEHRIESGLNCGGHAFPTQGNLLGPILEEFKQKRTQLQDALSEICSLALQKKKLSQFFKPKMKITVQGGIGTANENDFLFDHYDVDGTGWGTPFLLVPEATSLDDPTRDSLAKAQKEDLILSENSPLGIPFNTVKNTASEAQKWDRAKKGNPGSPCPKGHLISNNEFTDTLICTASKLFQRKKMKQINNGSLEADLSNDAHRHVLTKTCLCEDLAAGVLIEKNIDNKRPLKTAVCPGPNLAFFSKITSLSDMLGHIYGRTNVANDIERPNMFVAELKMYIDYFKKEVAKKSLSETYLQKFKDNMVDGIDYYKNLIPKMTQESSSYKEKLAQDLSVLSKEMSIIIKNTPFLNPDKVLAAA